MIGAAASAFDAAGVALEHGASAVHLFARRDTIAAIPITRSRGFPGAYDNFHQLPDADRWHQAIRFRRAGSTPTTDAIERTVRYPNFHLHLSAPWSNATANNGVETIVNGTAHRFDFVIAGTGYSAAIATRPEFGDFAEQILLWRDRYTPPPEEQDAMLAEHPYLGAGHEFLEKAPGAAPFLKNIHIQNPAGFVSFGLPIGDVPSMKRDIPVIVGRISADLFRANLATLRQRMTADVPPDFSDALGVPPFARNSVSQPAGGAVRCRRSRASTSRYVSMWVSFGVELPTPPAKCTKPLPTVVVSSGRKLRCI